MNMLCIGTGDRYADLIVEIQVYVEVGAYQLHQFNVFEIDHIGAVAPLDQCAFQLLLQPLHGIAKHDLFNFALLSGMNCHIIIGRLHIEDILRLNGKTQFIGFITKCDHFPLPEFQGCILCMTFQFLSLVLQ